MPYIVLLGMGISRYLFVWFLEVLHYKHLSLSNRQCKKHSYLSTEGQECAPNLSIGYVHLLVVSMENYSKNTRLIVWLKAINPNQQLGKGK